LTRMKIRHSVKDIDEFRIKFANIDCERQRHGVPSSVWEIDPNDPNTITIIHTVTDKNKQEAFRQSQRGKYHRRMATVVECEKLEQ